MGISVDIVLLILALFMILGGAEAFTNALEHLGEKLKLSEGVTGSIFAAVGTALPEAMVPMVAVFGSAASQEIREEIGVGAILGAPLMLSTLTFFLMACFAGQKRGFKVHLNPERTGTMRDLSFFLFAFALSIAAMFIPYEWRTSRTAFSLLLVIIYFFYLLSTIRASANLVAQGHGTEADHPLLLSKIGSFHHAGWIVLQLMLGFLMIVGGARLFVEGVENISHLLLISPLVLSLLIIPVATELPEKVNSILWIRRGKDTLAFSNITGAMVFQGTLLPAMGIFLTPWETRPAILAGSILTLIASLWLLIRLRQNRIRARDLFFNGFCYASYFLFLTL
jgi:cation:H+ antiporter